MTAIKLTTLPKTTKIKVAEKDIKLLLEVSENLSPSIINSVIKTSLAFVSAPVMIAFIAETLEYVNSVIDINVQGFDKAIIWMTSIWVIIFILGFLILVNFGIYKQQRPQEVKDRFDNLMDKLDKI